jgi:hypothetical protein
VDKLLGFGLFVALGVSAICATSAGMDVGQRDAPTYLAAAESLAAGSGYQVPFGDVGQPIDFDNLSSEVTFYPPGYPLVLSLGVAVGLDSLDAARVVSVLVLIALGAGVFLFSRRHGLKAAGSTVAALIGVGVSFPYLLIPQTDLFYGLLVFLVLAVVVSYAANRRIMMLVGASLGAAAGMSVRFIGLAIVATVALVALTVPGATKERIWRATLSGLIGLAPFLLTFGSGTLVWHPPNFDDYKIFAAAIADWFVPPIGSPALRIVVFLIGVGFLLWFVIRPGRARRTERTVGYPGWMPGVVSAVLHTLVVFGARALRSTQSAPNSRLLYPVAISLLVAGIVFYASRSERVPKPDRVRQSVAIVGIAALVAGTFWAAKAEAELRLGDLGYASASFVGSSVVNATVEGFPGELVFSDVPDGLWVAGLDGARFIPARVDLDHLTPNPFKESEAAEIARRVKEEGAVVFYFRGHQRPYLIDEDELRLIASCVIAEDEESVLLADPAHDLCLG